MPSKALVIMYKTKIRTMEGGRQYIDFKRDFTRRDVFTRAHTLRPMRPADHDFFNSDLFPGIIRKFAERLQGGRKWAYIDELPAGVTVEPGGFLSWVTYEEPAPVHLQDGGKMRVAIQCTDDRTGARGSFGYRTGRNTVHGVRFYSLTPVFSGLVELYGYMKENHIDVDDSPDATGIISF